MTISPHTYLNLINGYLPLNRQCLFAHRRFVHCLFTLLLLICLPCVAQEKQSKTLEQPSQEEIATYIQQLGSSSFETREYAAKELLRLGIVAEKALEKNARNPNPEIKRRIRSLLVEIKTHNRNSALQQFIDGKNPTETFPCWKRFKSIVGDNTLSRKLFHKMATAEWELLSLAENFPKQVDYQFYKRAALLKTKVYTTQVHPSLGSIATLLFIASDKQFQITGPAYSELQYLLSSPELSQALNHPVNATAIYQVLDNWVDSCVDNPHLKQQNRFNVLLFAIRENLKSGISLAKSVIETPYPDYFSSQNNVYLIYAVLGIAKLGSEKDIAYLETLLEDKQSVFSYVSDNRFETQLRDVALVGILHIKGKDPKKFGFPRLTVHPDFLYSYRTVGFASDAERKEAFDLWAKDLEEETSK
ncbi:MAG: hypothetical protein ACKVH8_11925 [Pirellulales bacterium]